MLFLILRPYKVLMEGGRLGHENKFICLLLLCWWHTSAILCFNYQTATISENTAIVCSHWITQYLVRHAIIFLYEDSCFVYEVSPVWTAAKISVMHV